MQSPFVLSLESENDRDNYERYYLSTIEIKNYNVVVIGTTQLHSTILCAGWNPACGLSKICDGENLWLIMILAGNKV